MVAASYAQVYTFAKSGSATLAQRLACAIVDYAESVVATEGTQVSGHAARASYATTALNDPDTAAAKMLLAATVVLGNAGNVTPTDADLKTTVTGLWNAMCGNI